MHIVGAGILDQRIDAREIHPALGRLDQLPGDGRDQCVEPHRPQPRPDRRHISAARRARIGKLAAEDQEGPAVDDELRCLAPMLERGRLGRCGRSQAEQGGEAEFGD